MSYIPNLYGFIDSNNSSTTALTSNSVYTGTSVESTDYSSLTVSITTDQSSATNGLSIQFSSDGTNWDIIRGDTITVGNPGTAFNTTFRYNIEARYYRIIYTNGTTGQSIFRLQSLLNAQSANSVGIYSSTIGTSRYKREINCTNSGALNVNLAEPTSTYGDVRMGCLTPLTQFDFVYGLNTNYITTTTATGGTSVSCDIFNFFAFRRANVFEPKAYQDILAVIHGQRSKQPAYFTELSQGFEHRH